MFAALVAARASSNHKATRFGGFSFFSTSAVITLSDDRHWLIRCARYRSGAYGLIILLFVLYLASELVIAGAFHFRSFLCRPCCCE